MKTDSGLRRCTCSAGRSLSQTDAGRKQGKREEPRISKESALVGVQMMAGCLNFFPPRAEEVERLGIANEIRSMCESDKHVLWLVERMAKLYAKWPGTREMRMVYCAAHRPLDGFEISGPTETYPDGIPSERQIEAPAMKALPPGDVSAADSINETVLALAVAKDIKNVRRSIPVPDIPILPPGKRISHADIDAAVNRNRERIAREELGL